jgi:hypothetical protein
MSRRGAKPVYRGSPLWKASAAATQAIDRHRVWTRAGSAFDAASSPAR